LQTVVVVGILGEGQSDYEIWLAVFVDEYAFSSTKLSAFDISLNFGRSVSAVVNIN
jgi:hypothetical protein